MSVGARLTLKAAFLASHLAAAITTPKVNNFNQLLASGGFLAHHGGKSTEEQFSTWWHEDV